MGVGGGGGGGGGLGGSAEPSFKFTDIHKHIIM